MNPTEVSLIQHNHVLQEFPLNRFGQAFSIRVLPWWHVTSDTSRDWHTNAVALPSDNTRSAFPCLRIICSGVCRLRFIIKSFCPITGPLGLSSHLDQILGSRPDLAGTIRRCGLAGGRENRWANTPYSMVYA